MVIALFTAILSLARRCPNTASLPRGTRLERASENTLFAGLLPAPPHPRDSRHCTIRSTRALAVDLRFKIEPHRSGQPGPAHQTRATPGGSAEQAYQLPQTAQPPPRPRWAGQWVVFYRQIPLGPVKKGKSVTDRAMAPEGIKIKSTVFEQTRPEFRRHL